jgi:hypothetical protein
MNDIATGRTMEDRVGRGTCLLLADLAGQA